MNKTLVLDNAAAIQVHSLHKSYPVIKGYRELLMHPFRTERIPALKGVDLAVKSGECFCLMGPNGAGKTTLIKILATLVYPERGDIYVTGLNVLKNPAGVKANIGYALNEERSFYWRLTGRQNLEFFAILNNIHARKRDRKINDVLQFTGLFEAADRRFNTYSTGMRQMMAVARALLPDPKILFVDEPTRSLDPKAAAKLRRFLRQEIVDKQGKTVFWATHDLNEAADFAHRIGILSGGRIHISGTLDELTGKGEQALQEVYEKYA